MVKSKTYIATPPGVTIKEQLQNRGMSQKEFAARMDMSEKHISKFLNGEVNLTPDMAVRLEMVLGLPASFWNKLEAIYREKLQLVKEENEMDEDKEFVKNFPYSEMSKFGWVESTKDLTKRVFEMRKFFEVVKLSLVKEPLIPGIVYRRQVASEKSDYALIAWAQKAKIEARNIETEPINLNKLKKIIPDIRSMTKLNPDKFCPELISLLSSCGIALVFLPHIGGSFLHGATFYDKDKIVIGLTVRGKDADKFWFSLFHEIGHILLGHINNHELTSEREEKSADEFSRDTLISKSDYDLFVNEGYFSKESILKFSNIVGIDVGITVGRLQKDGYIKYSQLNELKTKYTMVS